MDIPLKFKLFKSASELPEEWDEIGGNIFLSKDYLSVLETSAPLNMTCFFIGVFNDGILCGKAICQFLDLSNIKSFGERDNCIKNKIRTFVFRQFSSNVLIVGNNMLTGEHGCFFSPGCSITNAMESLHGAVGQIIKELRDSGFKTHQIIWKDFADEDTEYFKQASFHDFYRFSTQPNMVLQIPSEWESSDDYLSALTKKYRDQYKRVTKKTSGLIKRKMGVDEIRANHEKINQLYLTVARNAPFNTFYLHQNHFVELKQKLKDKFLFYGYFNNEELIGFNTLIKNGKDIDTYFLGYDEILQREKMLYLNMLYDMVAYSVNKKFKRIIFARTALEIKSSVGAKPVNLIGFIKHRNPVLNYLMPVLFKYFEPEIEWQQRHPFKE